MDNCGRCGHENPEDSVFCNSCGSRLKSSEVHPSSAQKGIGERTCPRCGKVVPPFMDVCQNCLTQMRSTRPVREQIRICPGCGRTMMPGATACTECMWGQPASPGDDEHRALGDKPIIVGILLVAAFALSMITAIGLLWSSGNAGSIPYFDVSGFLMCCGTMVGVASLSCLLGAILSFRRAKFSLVVLASAIGILGMGPLLLGSLASIIALVLAATSKDDYLS